EGSSEASRPPWKTARILGQASPTPGGRDSSITVVSTRLGRFCVPTSTTLYDAAGDPSFAAASSAPLPAPGSGGGGGAGGASCLGLAKAVNRERAAFARSL